MKKTLLLGTAAASLAVLVGFLPALASTTVTVTPTNMQGWTFVNDQTDATSTATGVIAAGPGTPPLGTGSAQFTISSPTDGQIVEMAHAGLKLSDITALTYSTYQDASNTSTATAVALQFNVAQDVTNASSTYQGRLVYEPYLNNGGVVPLGTWNQWDAKSGMWWLSKSSTLFGGNCSQASPCTFAQLEALYPNIGISPTFGAVVFKAGSGWNGPFMGAVDALTIGTAANTTTYNFDPTAAVVTIAAPMAVSPTNGATLTTAQLTKVDWTDVAASSTPVTYLYEVSNSSAVNADGSFVTPVYQSGTLTMSEIPTPGTPEGTYYWHARAVDSSNNMSAWSTTSSFTIDNTVVTPPPVTTPTDKDQCKNNGWKTFTNPSFKNQGQCVAYTNHN
jgi:hypothetical protein